MRIFYIILLIVVVIICGSVCGQNSTPVITVAFLGWSANASMSLVSGNNLCGRHIARHASSSASVWKRTRALSVHKRKLRETENQLKNVALAFPEVKCSGLR
jgi:hypothetical protein